MVNPEDVDYIHPGKIILVMLAGLILGIGISQWIQENCQYGGGFGGCF